MWERDVGGGKIGKLFYRTKFEVVSSNDVSKHNKGTDSCFCTTPFVLTEHVC